MDRDRYPKLWDAQSDVQSASDAIMRAVCFSPMSGQPIMTLDTIATLADELERSLAKLRKAITESR